MNVLLVGEAANHRDRLSKLLDFPHAVATTPVPSPDDPKFAAQADEFDVVVSLRIPRLPKPAQRFRLLQVPGAGLDGIELASVPKSAWVCNVFEHEIPIAEYVLMAMIHWASGFDGMRQAFSAQTWSATYRNRTPHGEISGRTLGLLGFGHIGRAIARRARAFGMKVIAVQRAPADTDGIADRVLPLAQMQEMLQQADFLVIACPLTDTTRGLVGDAELKILPDRSVLINVSRAEIVQEAPLYDALLTRRIAGAYLDVWYRYPAMNEGEVAPSSLPFHTLPNAVCTPHSSAWTRELFERRYHVIARNISRLRSGGPLENIVRAPLPQEGLLI